MRAVFTVWSDLLNSFMGFKLFKQAQTSLNLQPLAELFVKSMEESIQYVASLPPPCPDDKQWTQTSTDEDTEISGLSA